MKGGPLKLGEIARRIAEHLRRFEKDLKINAPRPGRDLRPYYQPGSWAAGRYVGVRYVSYQGKSMLTKSEAEQYLAWLDKGHVGKHFEVIR